MNKRIVNSVSNNLMVENLLNVLRETDNTEYTTVLEILEGLNICEISDTTGELIKLLDKMKDGTSDYRIKVLCIKIIANNMKNLLMNYADNWDVDICDEEVEYVSVCYGKLKIEKSYSYKLFDEYMDILKCFFESENESDYALPCSMSLESTESVSSISNDFSFLGVKYDYICRKFIDVLGEEEAYKKFCNKICHSCNNEGCSVLKKYERYNKLKLRMKIIGAFVSITHIEFGQSLDYVGMDFLGSSYLNAVSDTYDFLAYSEIGLKNYAITEKEASLVSEVYELDKQFCEKKISKLKFESEYKKLYDEFFDNRDVFSVIGELPAQDI